MGITPRDAGPRATNFADLYTSIQVAIPSNCIYSAAVSGGADLANAGDNAVIGKVTRSVLNALKAQPTASPVSTDSGSVDAAVVTLERRGLTPALFTVLDADSDEASTNSIQTLGGKIGTPGTILTNAQISAIFDNLADNPNDPAARDAVRVFKSGARTGTSSGLLCKGVTPVQPRTEKDGSSTVLFFINQLCIHPDATGDSVCCDGDSGSLWFQTSSLSVIGLNHGGFPEGTEAVACRIEDVLDELKIRFA
jgi:hypothetical protein